MKRIIAVVCFCITLGISSSAFAQCDKHATPCNHNQPTCNHDQSACKMSHPQLLSPAAIKLLKENYINENLPMSDKEKDAFWKSYNKYQKALEQARADAKAAREKAGIPCCKDKDAKQPTDAQKVAMYNIQLNKRQAELTAEQTFFKEISKTLNEEQVAKYLGLEKSFKMELAKLHHDNNGKGHYGHNGQRPVNDGKDMKCKNQPAQPIVKPGKPDELHKN